MLQILQGLHFGAKEVSNCACIHDEAGRKNSSNASHKIDIMVRTNDTDVFVLLIGHHDHFLKPEILFDCVVSSNNYRRMINATCITKMFRLVLVETLLEFQAFSGYDFIAKLKDRGKLNFFKLYKKKGFSKNLCHLGDLLNYI